MWWLWKCDRIYTSRIKILLSLSRSVYTAGCESSQLVIMTHRVFSVFSPSPHWRHTVVYLRPSTSAPSTFTNFKKWWTQRCIQLIQFNGERRREMHRIYGHGVVGSGIGVCSNKIRIDRGMVSAQIINWVSHILMQIANSCNTFVTFWTRRDSVSSNSTHTRRWCWWISSTLNTKNCPSMARDWVPVYWMVDSPLIDCKYLLSKLKFKVFFSAPLCHWHDDGPTSGRGDSSLGCSEAQSKSVHCWSWCLELSTYQCCHASSIGHQVNWRDVPLKPISTDAMVSTESGREENELSRRPNDQCVVYVSLFFLTCQLQLLSARELVNNRTEEGKRYNYYFS